MLCHGVLILPNGRLFVLRVKLDRNRGPADVPLAWRAEWVAWQHDLYHVPRHHGRLGVVVFELAHAQQRLGGLFERCS